MDLTLVAFHGPKPDPLSQLVDLLQTSLDSELGSAFSAYALDQVHATMIGLEGWREGAEVFNASAVHASVHSFAMDLRSLFLFLLEMSPLHIRIGGFASASVYPFTSRGLHPYTRSFTLNGLLAVTMGWPVAGESYPLTLDTLRRECMRYHVLHKYHRKADDIDNDFFLVLGRVKPGMVSEEKAGSVQNHLRKLLSEREPLDILVRADDLSVVAYVDTQLPIASSLRYSLPEAPSRVEELKLLMPAGSRMSSESLPPLDQ
jgi:hypothetical protein